MVADASFWSVPTREAYSYKYDKAKGTERVEMHETQIRESDEE